MTKEQEAIEYLKESILIYKNTIPKISESIGTVLSMLKENSAEIQQKNTELAEKNAEIEKKDKIIDLMAKAFNQDDVRTVEEIKQYFERKSKEC